MLNAEIEYQMQPETMDMFLDIMTEMRLKNKDVLIPYGKLDTNVYVVREGVISSTYIANDVEKTHAFCTTGTFFIPNSFYNAPSLFNYEACCDTIIMKITKADFEELLRQSDDFKSWVLRYVLEWAWNYQYIEVFIRGLITAEERFLKTVSIRPELLQKVSTKILAQYIGIHPNSLSRLKRQPILKLKK